MTSSMMPMPPSSRETALVQLLGVLVDGRPLEGGGSPEAAADPRDRAFASVLSFGVLRWLPRLEAVLARLLTHPLRSRDQDVRIILLLGIYQILYTRVPPYAAVTESVELARRRRKDWAAGLINGILRRLLREREALSALVDRDESAALAHPAWLLEALRDAWPDDWRRIVATANGLPPMALRVNLRRVDRDRYLETLAHAGIDAFPAAHTEAGLVLRAPVAAERLPGFAAGLVSIQDAAAQQAAQLLDPQPGERVLDACAAPGGKTAHLLERAPGLGELVALDRSSQRLARLRGNLERLGLQADIRPGDAMLPASWWDGRPFHRILLDAPCSATGIVRRHPDIKALRTKAQVRELARDQGKLLAALWPLLAPGGTLIYATCSVLPEENEEPMAGFLAAQPDAREVPIARPWGRARSVGRQILPGDDDMDGFYYACLARQ